MNDEIYLEHQYESLIKNATPQGLAVLAARLKAFAKTKIATVHVDITFIRDHDGLCRQTVGCQYITVELPAAANWKNNVSKGSRVSDALDSIKEVYCGRNILLKEAKRIEPLKAYQQHPATNEKLCPGTWVIPEYVYTLYLDVLVD